LIQNNGAATGAPNSCSYSDLALEPIDQSIFEAKVVSFNELFFYGRYRDDCIVLWLGTEARAEEFLKHINTLDAKLKFTMEFGGDTICFLDLKITIVGGQLYTTVYSKPTDSHLYLHGTSCHVTSSVNGIQKGVALRLRRICSSTDEFDEKAKLYKAYLVARGHDPIVVAKSFEDIRILTRNEARQKKTRTTNRKIFFATRYNPKGPDIYLLFKSMLK